MKKSEHEAKQEYVDVLNYLKDHAFPILHDETEPGKNNGSIINPQLLNILNARLLAHQNKTKRLMFQLMFVQNCFIFYLIWKFVL